MGYKRAYYLISVHGKIQRRTSHIFLIICLFFSFFFLISIIWKLLKSRKYANDMLKEFENRGSVDSYTELNRQARKFKYMLLWTPEDYAPFNMLTFNENQCPSVNCFVTADRNHFNGDLTQFDAIAFNGRNFHSNMDLPKYRTVRQKYIFFNMESAENYPICSNQFDDFFNWTATYRLDSDIPFPYIQIRNQRDEVVGPKWKMEWPDNIYTDEVYRQNKTKAVAWFVSNCDARSNRMKVAFELQKELNTYGLTVDIYGACGQLWCPRFDKDYDCESLLSKDYFFYLSFENSFSEDYVTEKLLTALQNNVVPIVLGGADYNRFLPPGSYLDARTTSARSLAATINEVMSSPTRYNEFFRWKSLYKYRDPSTTDSVCALCAALNNETLVSTPSYYPDFRSWWHPGYKERCFTTAILDLIL